MSRVDALNMDTEFLCDLWMKLSQFSNHETIRDEECSILTDVMEKVEQALIIRLQNELPIFRKAMLVLTDFGNSEFSKNMDPLLKDYNASPIH